MSATAAVNWSHANAYLDVTSYQTFLDLSHAVAFTGRMDDPVGVARCPPLYGMVEETLNRVCAGQEVLCWKNFPQEIHY